MLKLEEVFIVRGWDKVHKLARQPVVWGAWAGEALGWMLAKGIRGDITRVCSASDVLVFGMW